MKRFYDKHHQIAKSFNIGDLVLLDATNLRSTCPSHKLDDKRFGPFKIVKQISPVNYELELPSHWRLSTNVFHVSKLFPFTSNPNTTNRLPPAPDLIDDHLEYEVETILDSQLSPRGGLQYLVKWKGYGREDNSWEPARNLTNTKEAISLFHRTHPQAPQNIGSIFSSLIFKPYENLTDNPPLLPSTWHLGSSLVVEDSP